MKFSLIDPFSHSIDFPPLGLAYLGAVAEESGADVEILPLTALGLSDEDCVAHLQARSCDLVGLACHSMSAFSDTRSLAISIKKHIPDCQIILGGIYPSFCAEKVLRDCSAFDGVIRREGEGPIRQLVENGGRLVEVAGASFIREDRFISNAELPTLQDLDLIPLPARHLLPLDKFKRGRGAILTSRGCRFNCSYCSPRVMFSRFRKHSLARVISEIKVLVNEYDIRAINILDDDFTGDQQRVFDLCRLIQDRVPSIQWACSGRVDELQPQLLNEMSQAGCTQIFIGIESLNDANLKTLKRGYTADVVRRVVSWIQEAGISVKCGVIVGLPWQTPEEAQATCHELDVMGIEEVSPSFYTPLPGTRAWRDVKKGGGRILEVNHEKYDFIHPIVDSDNFPIAAQKSMYLELLSLNAERQGVVTGGD